MGRKLEKYGRFLHECVFDWPENCFVQAGDGGIVFVKSPQPGEPSSYNTAFFEAFPRNPNTFIRGEGATVTEAEANCWKKYQRIANCPGHDYDRRGRRDGYAYCKNCGLGTMAFEALETCIVCGKPTYYAQDNLDQWYCEIHALTMPEELWTDSHREHLKYKQAMEQTSKEDLTQAIGDILNKLAN